MYGPTGRPAGRRGRSAGWSRRAGRGTCCPCTFKVYTQVYALFGGRAGIANSATTAVYYIYDKFHIAGRPGIAMAATVILFVIILVVTFLQNKLLKKVGQ